MLCRTLPKSPLSIVAFSALMLLGCGAAGDGDDASQSGAVALGSPTAAFAEDFGAITTVRELPDGRVMVADPLGGALYAVDLEAGTREQIGSEGQGPEEYRQPDAVWALPGDSTLVIDLGNGRMITLGPDLSFGDTSPLSTGDPRSGMIVAIPQAVDRDGHVYARSMGGGMGMEPPDSGAVLRVTRGSLDVDTVANFKLEDRFITRTSSARGENVSLNQIPLSLEDAWGVAPDGSVVVARSGDYHIEWFGSDGIVTRGAPQPFDAISIGAAEKEEWAREQSQSGGGIGIQIEVDNGRMQTSFGRGGGRDDEDLDQYEWPEVKAPFYGGRVVVDGQNRAWIRRHVEAGADATYDVFDRGANRIATYTLPNNRRIIGFGEGNVYVVASDDFDLNYLERYALPAM